MLSSPLWLIISREDALHQPDRLLILAVGNGRRRNDWGSSRTMFTSWQRRLALCVCSSKHFHLAHFWSPCLIFLWRQKSFKPHSILGQHIYWRLALQYLREINTAPWFMNPCHPPTGFYQGARATLVLLLPPHTMGFGYQEGKHMLTPPPRYTQQRWIGVDFSENLSGSCGWIPPLKRGPLNIGRVRHAFPFCFWQVRCKIWHGARLLAAVEAKKYPTSRPARSFFRLI